MEYLQRLNYPGNIRELKNLVERTLLVSGKDTLDVDDFKAQNIQPIETDYDIDTKGLTLEESERQHILQTLKKYDNNLTQAAVALGITRQALYRRLEKFNIKV